MLAKFTIIFGAKIRKVKKVAIIKSLKLDSFDGFSKNLKRWQSSKRDFLINFQPLLCTVALDGELESFSENYKVFETPKLAGSSKSEIFLTVSIK